LRSLLLRISRCNKSKVGWGFVLDHTGEFTVIPRPPTWISGWPLCGTERKGRELGWTKREKGEIERTV